MREGAPLGEEGAPSVRERATKCKVRAAMCPPTQLSYLEEEEGATSQEVGCPLWECTTSQEGHTSFLACAQIHNTHHSINLNQVDFVSIDCHLAF
jgi:hypothetical protein